MARWIAKNLEMPVLISSSAYSLHSAFIATPFVNKFSATTTPKTTVQQFSLVSLGSVRFQNFPPFIDFHYF